MLKLGRDGDRIYARLVCKKTGGDEPVDELLVMDTETPGPTSPVDGSDLSGVERPNFTFGPGGGKRWWFEFSAGGAFTAVAGRLRARRSPAKISKSAWKGILKRLEKDGAAGTGYWRMVQKDAIGRSAMSAPRSFTYTSP